MEFFNWIVYADGACSGNPGPGGWGALVVSPEGQVVELGGAAKITTNNKMELLAVANGLQEIIQRSAGVKSTVRVYTDSKYVIQGMSQWIHNWKRNRWISSTGEPVKNQPLWQELDDCSAKLNIQWQHVRGHNGHPGNERVDEIATSFCAQRPVPLYRGALDRYSISRQQLEL
jgi:ribonuclease HI